MKVRGYDTLEGAHSLWRFWREISSFSGDFLKTLTDMGSIHLVGVQTWLRRSHAGKKWWHPRGGSFVVMLLKGNLFLFGDFLKTLTEIGSIHWVGVQTWLQSSHGLIRCHTFWGNSPTFRGTFCLNVSAMKFLDCVPLNSIFTMKCSFQDSLPP